MVKYVKEFSAKKTKTLGKRKTEVRQCQKLRGICYIDPEELDARRKLESHMESAHASRKEALEEQLERRRRCLEESNNAMNVGRKRLCATTKFL